MQSLSIWHWLVIATLIVLVAGAILLFTRAIKARRPKERRIENPASAVPASGSTTPENQIRPASANFVVRLWHGDVSLAITYWVFGLLGGVALRLLSPAVTYEVMAHAQSMSAFDIQALLYGWTAIVFVYSIFILVAIWRSANKYRVLKPASKSNATLAQIACVLGAITTVGSVISVFSANEDFLQGSSADDKLQYDAMIAGLNADLPKKIDSVTTLTKIDLDQSGFKYFETVSIKIDKTTFPQRMKRALATPYVRMKACGII